MLYRSVSYTVAFVVLVLLPACSSRPQPLKKEVLFTQDGKDRHWVFTRDGLIHEEHGLTAHGDLHMAITYKKGVRHAQIDAPQEHQESDVERQVTIHWPEGQLLSRSTLTGFRPDGTDQVWFKNGQLARLAYYSKDRPVGTWEFYDSEGALIAKGDYRSGKRFSGSFVGNEAPGADYLFSVSASASRRSYEEGVLLKEENLGGLLKRERHDE